MQALTQAGVNVEKIERGEGEMKDLALLESVAGLIMGKTLCAFGDAAATPVLTTLKWFKPEYEAYAKGKAPAAADYRARQPSGRERATHRTGGSR